MSVGINVCHWYKSFYCRGFAKRTLLKTARRAGIKTKDSSTGGKRSKYVIPTPPMARRTFGMAGNSDTLTGNSVGDPQQLAMFEDDLSGLLCLITSWNYMCNLHVILVSGVFSSITSVFACLLNRIIIFSCKIKRRMFPFTRLKFFCVAAY